MASWPYNTTTWKRLRLAKLAHDPLCTHCALRSIVVQAVAVDHVVSIAKGGNPFPALDGLASLCLACHSHKTNAIDRPDRHASGRAVKGFDVDGNPLDPTDDWHGGASNHEDGLDRRPALSSKKDLLSANRSQLDVF